MASPVRVVQRHGTAAPDEGGASPRRTMVRATAAVTPEHTARPLAVVEPRRRWTLGAVLVGAVCVVLGVAMLGAAAYQTQLAQRQLRLDVLDRELRTSMQQYEALRRERAELLAPDRLAQIAESYAMRSSTDGEFVMVAPDVQVAVQQSTGSLDQDPPLFGDGLLEEYRTVKGLVGGAP